MKIFPIIPIWLITIICLGLIIYILMYNNKNIKQILIVLLLFIINLRIMTPSDKLQELTNNLDITFVIDNTISMNAEDYNKNNTRLSAVKKDCKYITEKLNGSRYSVITFNNTAKVVTPYTKDINITNEIIEIIEPINELYAKGSSLNTPLNTIIQSLKSAQKKENRIQILFFISDGEITDDSTLESYKEVSKYIDNGAVLGYGTKKGGYMKTKSKYDEEEKYITDYDNFDKAISKFNDKNLKQIADDMKIDFIHMEKQNKINNKLKEIKNNINNTIKSNNKTNYDDTYYILIIPLFILIILEFNKVWRKII